MIFARDQIAVDYGIYLLNSISSSSIISSSEKVGLSAGMEGCEVSKIDGEAGGDEDDDSKNDEPDDQNDDSDNLICSSEN